MLVIRTCRNRAVQHMRILEYISQVPLRDHEDGSLRCRLDILMMLWVFPIKVYKFYYQRRLLAKLEYFNKQI